MNRLLAALNPLALALRFGRGAVGAIASVRLKVVLVAGAAAAVPIVALAAVYTMTAPMTLAKSFAASLRGGAPDLPPDRAACIPASSAVEAGRYTAVAQEAIGQIPSNVTIAPATAFLLFRWSHTGEEDWRPTWAEWEGVLAEHAVSSTASDIEIAQTVDPAIDYTLYLVPARSTTIGLSFNGPVVADKRQLSELADQIYRTCQQEAEQRHRGVPATATVPVQRTGEYTENNGVATTLTASQDETT